MDWITQWIDRLVELTGFNGYSILLLTVPLSIVQGIFSLFPFASLMILHISSFGSAQGIFFSWLLGTVASIIAFVIFRYFFYEWFKRRMEGRLARYGKWQKYMDIHGGWVVILLRSIPIIPNNVISFMAAISPIRPKHYMWSTAIGMFSNIWLLGLIGTTLTVSVKNIAAAWILYMVFCASLLAGFLVRFYRNK